MEIHESPFKSITEKAENYANITWEILKLKAAEKSSFIFSKIIIGLLLLLLFTLITFLFSIGISLWVGDLLGSACLGFFIVSGSLILIAFILYKLQYQIISKHITKLFLHIFD